MAEFSLSSNHSQLSAKIVYSYTQSVSGNYSDVSATLYIKKNQSIATSGTWSGDINVGGSGNSGSQYYKLVDSWQWLCDVSKRVYHNADGTGSVTISGSARGPSGTSMSSASASGSETISLPRIARTSSVSATSAKIGATSTITISRQSSSFTHTLSYSFKGETTTALTGTIVSKTSDTSVSWTIPKEFYNKIPNSTSGTVTITCTTYSGSSSVGSSTCTLTASANSADIQVSFNPTYADTNTTTTALTGDSSKLVRYYSTAKVTSNAAGAYGATISSQSIKCGSKTVSSSPASFPNVETFTFTFSATDSRGYTTTKNLTATNVVDYCKLTSYIGNETPAADGTYTFKVKGNYFNGSFGAVNNTLNVIYRWKVSGGTFSNWQNMTLSISGNTYVATANLSGLDYQTTYIFEAQATDKLMAVDTGEKAIKSKPTFDWSGEDFAFNVPVTIMDKPVYTETVLFSGSTNGTVTLSDSAANYEYLEIYFTDNNNRGGGYTKLYSADGQTVHLDLVETNGSGAFYIRHTNYTVSGSSITPISNKYGYSYWDGSKWSNGSASNYLKITRVVGVK